MALGPVWAFVRPTLYCVLAWGAFTEGVGAQTIVGTATIVDGDTLTVSGLKIRIWGIDAPESQQQCEADGRSYVCGKEATRYLGSLVAEREAACTVRTHDRYQRAVAVCVVEGKDLGAEMVRAGRALAFVRYSSDYVAIEQEARSAGRGLWAGQYTKPWEWRAQRRQ